MHILTRQVNQSIVIDETLQVTVLEIREDHVRLAFSCPDRSPSYWEETLHVECATSAQREELLGELQLR